MDVQQVDEEVSFNFKQQSTPMLHNSREGSFEEHNSKKESVNKDATLDYTCTKYRLEGY